MHNPYSTKTLIWAPLLLILLNNIPTASAQWGLYNFQIQPYFLLDFWIISPNEVAEFVLVLEQRPGNGRSAHYAQALQRGPACGGKNALTSVTSSSSTTSSSSVVRPSTTLATSLVVGGTPSLVSSLSSNASSAMGHSSSSLTSSSVSSSVTLSSSTVSSVSSVASSSVASSSALSSSASPSSVSHPPSSSSATSSRPSATSGIYGDASVNTTNKGLTFVTKIQLGTQSFQAVVDTGSSDTWVVQDGYQCTDPNTGDILSPSTCNFGPTYQKSPSFTQIPNENFHQAYTDGESLSGILGTETVTVAGITVPEQEIAIVNSAAYNGDGVSSGLLGLGFPANTRAYSGTNVAQDSAQTQKIYNPLFTNMYSKGHVSPVFSLALDRSGGGQLAFGGLPPVSYTPNFASAAFQILQTSNPDGQVQNTSAYTFYTITVGGFAVGGASSAVNNTAPQMIVDSGTTQNYVPEAVADAVNYAFNPPPFYKDSTGDYIISCTSKPSTFGVVIGGKTFTVDPRDMIINQGGRCISGVAATGTSGTSILGHSFLKNVVAVFDVGAQIMRFAPHIY